MAFQWESIRERQTWGSRGGHGEEWRSMHKRFRRRFQQFINLSRDQESCAALTSNVLAKETPYGDYVDVNEEDVELVVLLVTQGGRM